MQIYEDTDSSIISFFSIICRLGLDSVIINEMIKQPEKRGSYLGSALVMRLFTSIASLFCIMGIVRILEPDNPALYIITGLQSFAVILQSYEVFSYWFQLNLRMKYVSIATMIAQTAVGIWRISLLANNASIYYFAFSSSIQYLVCGAVVIFFFVKENKDLKLRFSRFVLPFQVQYPVKSPFYQVVKPLCYTPAGRLHFACRRYPSGQVV